MAHRAKNHCSEIFRFAIAEEKCRSDPSHDIGAAMKRPAPVRHRAKIDAKDLPAFFARLRADAGERMSHLALRWTIRRWSARGRRASPSGARSKLGLGAAAVAHPGVAR